MLVEVFARGVAGCMQDAGIALKSDSRGAKEMPVGGKSHWAEAVDKICFSRAWRSRHDVD